MSAVRLLTAPVDAASNQETQSRGASLVRLNPLALTARESYWKAPSHEDEYVWTASAGEDGSFTFYAAPRSKASAESRGASQWDGEFTGSDWQKLAMQQAAAQYAMTSAMPVMVNCAAATGKVIDVYA
jgi:hypothetical protein